MKTKPPEKIRPIIKPELAEYIQQYANENTNGNFTKAVEFLVTDGLMSNGVPMDYASSKKPGKEFKSRSVF